MSRRVVITGMGVVSPLGNDLHTFWEALMSGKSGAGLISKFDTGKFKTKIACEIKNFNPEDFGISKKEVNRLDLYTQYALASVYQAIHATKLLEYAALNRERVGVIWGSGKGGVTTIYEGMAEYFKNDETPRFSPFFIPKILIDIASGHISMKYKFTGPSFATISACATSSNSIIDAFNYIKLNKADVIITGGSEASINPMAIGGFNGLHALSMNNEAPGSASKPFDKGRDGFVMGEGGAALIVESLEHAQQRGAKIYAEIVGTGMTSDAYHLTAPHPEGKGAIRAMEIALQEAHLKPEHIDYINAHATSTPVGDIAELGAISKLFGGLSHKIDVSSTKGAMGHLLGAAGAIEAIVCVLAIENQTLPYTLNLKEVDVAAPKDINLLIDKVKIKKISTTLSNNFGFGGHNTSIIFEKFQYSK